MLKIKESVKLKNLEKYGFKKPKQKSYGNYYEYNNGKGTYLYVFENGKISISMLNGAMTDHYAALNKIYDLIQAGIIEKVDDDR